jgi:hypothetical protein
MKLEFRLAARAFFFAAAVAAGGCGDDSGAGGVDGGGVDSGADAAVDGALVDGEVDSGPPPVSCSTPVQLDTDLELDSSGPDTQIHARARFDGEAVWLTYNLPNAEGNFDVYGARINCDGSQEMAPIKLNTTEGGNSVDPDFDLAGSNVLVVWSRDSGDGTQNMDAYFRTYTLDGTPLMEADESLETTRDGTPVVGNVMFPAVSALSAERFVVTASRALQETSTFQAFIQDVSPDGALLGEARDVYVESAVTHTYPTIAAVPPDTVYLAWVQSEDFENETVFHSYFSGDATEPTVSPPLVAIPGYLGASPSLCATSQGGESRVYLAMGSQSGTILLKDGADFSSGTSFVELGSSGETDHSPMVACDSHQGGVVVYYRNVSGLNNRVIAQAFSFDGESFDVGEEIVVSEGPAAPYPPALTHIGATIYFMAWSQGESPDFRLKGRFVEIESP